MLYPKRTVLAIALAAGGTNGFSELSIGTSTTSKLMAQHRVTRTPTSSMEAARLPMDTAAGEKKENDDSEVERLQRMAAALRAEAASLESQRRDELSRAVEQTFLEFDTNRDGNIDLVELKAGLEHGLKREVGDHRAEKIMEDFDASGDGALQLEEFATIDRFRNRLEQLEREENRLVRRAAMDARREENAAKALEEEQRRTEENAPTGTEKVVATLPYLLPLLDSLQFSKFIFMDGAENFFPGKVALLYAIPVAFFAFSVLSSNPRINSLIRFNMKQALFIEIAVSVPGLLGALASSLLSGDVPVPRALPVIWNDAIFAAVALACFYGAASSLLGQTPDKIPFVSDIVNQRLARFEAVDIEEINGMDFDEKTDSDEKD